MSSGTYSAELRPDAMLRRLVLVSGGVLGASGVALILVMPFNAMVLIAGSAAWLAYSGWELVGVSRGYARCRRLRVTAGGEMKLLDAEGNWRAARLLPCSVLLRRVGWIRGEDSEGRQYAEPVRGSCRESDDWRRLQVIWRHIGATT